MVAMGDGVSDRGWGDGAMGRWAAMAAMVAMVRRWCQELI
jgi:hypothetical protein